MPDSRGKLNVWQLFSATRYISYQIQDAGASDSWILFSFILYIDKRLPPVLSRRTKHFNTHSPTHDDFLNQAPPPLLDCRSLTSYKHFLLAIFLIIFFKSFHFSVLTYSVTFLFSRNSHAAHQLILTAKEEKEDSDRQSRNGIKQERQEQRTPRRNEITDDNLGVFVFVKKTKEGWS